jgi:hypothetical protein
MLRFDSIYYISKFVEKRKPTHNMENKKCVKNNEVLEEGTTMRWGPLSSPFCANSNNIAIVCTVFPRPTKNHQQDCV